MSKTIETTIQIQTQEYLNKIGLLFKYQLGFRANFSTDSSLVQLTDFILREMGKEFNTGRNLVDLQKVVGTLDHYLYKDLPQALNETGSYLYADDTCIFYQDQDVEKIEKVLNKEFLSLFEWFIDNKLSIHFWDDNTKTIFSLE